MPHQNDLRHNGMFPPVKAEPHDYSTLRRTGSDSLQLPRHNQTIIASAEEL
jgi:hypothetical protein